MLIKERFYCQNQTFLLNVELEGVFGGVLRLYAVSISLVLKM